MTKIINHNIKLKKVTEPQSIKQKEQIEKYALNKTLEEKIEDIKPVKKPAKLSWYLWFLKKLHLY
jgi:hypothetical protein